MANEKKLYLKGLYTYRDKFSEIPEGALSQALNVTLDKANIANPRPGFNVQTLTPTVTTAIHSLQDYSNYLYLSNSGIMYRTGTQADTIGTPFVNLNYDVGDLASDSTFKILNPIGTQFNYAQMTGNLYFTTNLGVRKTKASQTSVLNAGLPQPAKVDVSLNGAAGFLPTDREVSYRVVFFRKDDNGVIVQGPPSARYTRTNATGGNRNVAVYVGLPSEYVSGRWWLQIYRTQVSAIGLSGDEMLLVYEGVYSTVGAASGVSVIDISHDSAMGAALYTNNTQQGIAAASYAPPYSTCIERFNNAMFYANTKGKLTISLRLLSGLVAGQTVTLVVTNSAPGSSTTTKVLTAGTDFTIGVTDNVAADIETTARNLVYAISSMVYIGSETTSPLLEAFYMSGDQDLPGQIMINATQHYTSSVTITYSGVAASFSPSISTATSFTQEVNPNRLWFSKVSEPEAVPLVNYKDIGDLDDPIIAIKALRDRLIIIKTRSIWRLVGSNAQSYDIQILDNTVSVQAPLSVARLSNRIFALSNQGIIQISDGVQIISRRIHDKVTGLNGVDACAASDEARGLYFLYTRPSSSTTMLVYNSYNDLFTEWVLPSLAIPGVSHVSSIYISNQTPLGVPSPNNRLLGVSNASPEIYVERKHYTSLDYSDNSLVSQHLVTGGLSGSTLNISDTTRVGVGDTILESGVGATGVCEVLSVDSDSTLTVQLTSEFHSNAASTPIIIYKAINTTIEFWPFLGEGIDIYKEFNEAALMYPVKLTGPTAIDFKTDEIYTPETVELENSVTTAMWGHFPWGGIPWGHAEPTDSLDERVIVPFNATKGHQLVTTVHSTTSNQLWEFSGITIKYRNIGFTPNRRQK
jgi:hypothetical protein